MSELSLEALAILQDAWNDTEEADVIGAIPSGKYLMEIRKFFVKEIKGKTNFIWELHVVEDEFGGHYKGTKVLKFSALNVYPDDRAKTVQSAQMCKNSIASSGFIVPKGSIFTKEFIQHIADQIEGNIIEVKCVVDKFTNYNIQKVVKEENVENWVLAFGNTKSVAVGSSGGNDHGFGKGEDFTVDGF